MIGKITTVLAAALVHCINRLCRHLPSRQEWGCSDGQDAKRYRLRTRTCEASIEEKA
jgi:hypothetical protein